MANSPQARKRARQSEKRRRHNMSFRSMTRTMHKKVLAAIGGNDKDAATKLYHQFSAVLDSMANKGIVHRNKAARLKSRLNTKLKQV